MDSENQAWKVLFASISKTVDDMLWSEHLTYCSSSHNKALHP